jgi:hypothetical protein
MPVDSERKTFGERLTTTAMGWLAQQSMEAYSLWMAWLNQSDPEKQQALREMQTDKGRKLVREAYERSRREQKRRMR